MHQIKKRVQAILSYILTVLLVGAYPLATYAETTPEGSTAPSSEAAPTTAPDSNYIYDAATGRWNTDSWKYSASTGAYESVPAPVAVAPVASTESSSSPATTSTPVGPSLSGQNVTGANNQSATDLGANSATNTIALSSGTTIATNNLINNTTGSSAQTGGAAVVHNTAAGNATTGNATVSETVMNTINSSVANGAGGIANFVSNISGDVHGDILLYPMILGAMLVQAALTPSSTTVSANTTLDTNTNNQVTNNINLDAASGTATVAGNTIAGNATSGSANAVANVVNMINSIVAANQSFIGTINIYGNLDGDILIAPDFISRLIGSNGSTSINQTANITTKTTDIITNNINLDAASGTATVAGNTIAGNATSGSAGTNVVILNLTGHEVVASNSMLVFVNVLGRWVGVIVDAPAGSTAAALGNGINQDIALNASGAITAQTTNQITNNIAISSRSGDAIVTDNTKAGNATTGNATASANILNMSQSSLNLSGWFGILFINVFGSWLGSFGTDTERGNPAVVTSGSGEGSVDGTQAPQAIQFVPKPASSVSSWRPNLLMASGVGDINDSPSVLGSRVGSTPDKNAEESLVGSTVSNQTPPNIAAAIIGVLVLLGAAAGSVWLAAYRRSLKVV